MRRGWLACSQFFAVLQQRFSRAPLQYVPIASGCNTGPHAQPEPTRARRAGSPQPSWAPLNPNPCSPLCFLQDAAKQRDALGLILQLQEHQLQEHHGAPGAPSAPSFCPEPPRALPPTPAAAGSARGPRAQDAAGAGTRQPRGRARRAMCLQQRSAKPPQGSQQQGTQGALRRDLKSKYVRGEECKRVDQWSSRKVPSSSWMRVLQSKITMLNPNVP